MFKCTKEEENCSCWRINGRILGQVIKRDNWSHIAEIYTRRSWHKVDVACSANPVLGGCCVIQWYGSPAFDFPLSTCTMWTSLDDVRYIKETTLYTNNDAVFNNQPRNSSAALLPFPAFTGCDNTSYFANHTKQSSWKVFREHHNQLKNLGIGELTQETIKSAEAFVCRMYNVHITYSADSTRHMLFSKNSKPEAMSLTIIIDALHFHLMRVHYETMVWRNAHCATPDLHVPV